MKKKFFAVFLALAFVIGCVFAMPAVAAEEKKEAPAIQMQTEPEAALETAQEEVQEEVDLSKLNINEANINQLQNLKGIGPKLAEEIINYRNTNGPFETIEDLMKVKGIGEKKFEIIKDLIRAN